MAGNKEDTKFRILAVERMLRQDKPISTSTIMRRLDLWYDIRVDRKTIYSDLRAIERFLPLRRIPGRFGGYQLFDVLKEVENGL